MLREILMCIGYMVLHLNLCQGYEDNDPKTEGDRLTKLLYPTGYYKG